MSSLRTLEITLTNKSIYPLQLKLASLIPYLPCDPQGSAHWVAAVPSGPKLPQTILDSATIKLTGPGPVINGTLVYEDTGTQVEVNVNFELNTYGNKAFGMTSNFKPTITANISRGKDATATFVFTPPVLPTQ